ncbi:MAG: MFS transporter [Methanomicrobiales archaeon]|nr:MFS transporter [Methanomicrobiales archaeon]
MGLKLKLIQEQFYLLLLLSLTVILVMAGESMLTAALVEIEHEFSVPGIYESWVLPVVLLVGAVAAPFVGTAGDRYGHKKLLLICLAIYLTGLLVGYHTPDIWILLFSRALQGAGIAAFPLAYAIIREQMTKPSADIGIGVISAMYGAGTFLGVIIGSWITGLFSWRLTYLFLIPLTGILLVLIFFYIKDTRSDYPGGSLDYAGFSSLLIFLFLVLSLFSLPEDERYSLNAVGLCVLSVIFLWTFIRIEKKARYPLADIRLLHKRPVIVLMVIGFLCMFSFFLLLQMMPYVIRLPTGLFLSAEIVGLVIVPGTLCDMIAGPLTGRMVPLIGCRIPCIVGSLMLAVSGVMLFILPLSVLVLVLAWMIFSFGMSVIATADLIGVLEHAGEEQTAQATGIIQSMQTLGGVAGPVITGLILASSQISTQIDSEEWIIPTTDVYYLVFFVVIVISLLLLGVSWFFIEEKKHTEGDL